MAPTTTTKQWVLREQPYGTAVLTGEARTFEMTTTKLPARGASQVLLKTVFLSNDPAQRSWISPLGDPRRTYLPPIQPGEQMRALGLARVVESDTPDLPCGTLVLGRTGWSEYSVQDANGLTPIKPPDGLQETHFLGALGLPGFTAYYALTEIVKLVGSDVLVVSAAAGAVGSMVIQIAKKVIGCGKIIGFAGTDEKCRWVESLGADVCLNYKASTFEDDLARETPDFVDVFFDNVGGSILDQMLTRMNKFGRVAACGTISNYNRDDDLIGLKNFYEVIMMRLKILGFINIDWFDNLKDVQNILVEEWKKGNLVIDDATETIVDTTFEDIPKTWMRLFEGGHQGKLVTRLIES